MLLPLLPLLPLRPRPRCKIGATINVNTTTTQHFNTTTTIQQQSQHYQGFPESVAPQYASYMGWRGVQYFFGGAMGVFTTKCLLGALGVAGRHSVRSAFSRG